MKSVHNPHNGLTTQGKLIIPYIYVISDGFILKSSFYIYDIAKSAKPNTPYENATTHITKYVD